MTTGAGGTETGVRSDANLMPAAASAASTIPAMTAITAGCFRSGQVRRNSFTRQCYADVQSPP